MRLVAFTFSARPNVHAAVAAQESTRTEKLKNLKEEKKKICRLLPIEVVPAKLLDSLSTAHSQQTVQYLHFHSFFLHIVH